MWNRNLFICIISSDYLKSITIELIFSVMFFNCINKISIFKSTKLKSHVMSCWVDFRIVWIVKFKRNIFCVYNIYLAYTNEFYKQNVKGRSMMERTTKFNYVAYKNKNLSVCTVTLICFSLCFFLNTMWWLKTIFYSIKWKSEWKNGN